MLMAIVSSVWFKMLRRLAQFASLALVAISPATAAGPSNSVFFSGEPPCPSLCNNAGPDPANWTVYHSADRLGYCDAPLVLSFAVFNPLDDPETGKSIGACALTATSTGTESSSGEHESEKRNTRPGGLHLQDTWRAIVRRQSDSSNKSEPLDQEQPINVAWKSFGTKSTGSIDIVSQTGQLKSFLDSPKIKSSAQGPTLYFLYDHDASTTLGIYAGLGVPTSPLLEAFNDVVKSRNYPGQILVQGCGSASPAVGVVAASGSDSLVAAQRAVRQWANSTCVSTDGFESDTLSTRVKTVNIGSVDYIKGSRDTRTTFKQLHRRADCTTESVKSGDLCADLASRCGISVNDLLKFNPQSDFCTSLKVPQLVCCSQGDLPVPKPDSDGNCATYKIDSGDSCWGITEKYSGLITTDDLEKYNKQTWGWGGCSNLQLKTRICVSAGNPPLPDPVKDAACGPVKPGTTMPPSGTELSSLNPCPLNSCCSVYGFCGTTEEFCRPIPEGQAPGAPQPPGGANCISNCGMDIVNNEEPPKEFVKVGYFEGYGISRPCNRVGIRTIDMSKYTHIHFAFATVTRDSYEVDMGPTINQFAEFKKITGAKKILSFGGWAFSTEYVDDLLIVHHRCFLV